MSKMPAKKKSCFQITSVTQAQVAAVGAADDTESLDDPDESRTEDVSSEMYDVSRAEYEPACERSSSDEALNNVGETEAPSSNPPQTTQPSGPGVNTSGELRKVHGAQSQSELGSIIPASTPQPAVGSSSTTSTVSCSSRFRVIKLDHGTGEPFRRGRWTCTEFYEKDSEASHAGRTDSIRHASVTLDPAADRDSGLGPSVGSTVSPATHSGPALGSMAEGSHPSLTHQQVLQQSYSSPATHGGKAAAHSSMGGPQPHAAQNVLPIGQNGLPLFELHIQKSPMMPPPYVPQHPLPGVHPITSQPAALLQHQTECYQQSQPASVLPGLPGGQLSLPVSSLSAAAGGHVPTSAMPLASGAPAASQIGDVGAAVVGSVSAGQPALAALQQPQTAGFGGPGGGVLLGGSAPPHQPQPIGHPVSSGVQNVPAVGVGPSAPTGAPAGAALSASSVTVPNATASSLPLGALGVQGLPASGFGQVEVSGGRTSDGLAVAQSPVASGWEAAKPFMSETLQLSSPVTSLFGIHIPVDGEDDRNPSTAFYQAFQSGSRLRDSKAHSNSASGTNIVAIDNKIEQAMDLVKSHLMYAVREEVEVLKEQIKELFERNSVLERENAVLKSLANSEQLSQLSAQTGAAIVAAAAVTPGSSSASGPQQLQNKPQQPQTQLDAGQQPQPNVSSA